MMRNSFSRVSFVLCLACICMAAVALVTKIDDPRPKTAEWAMAIWVYFAWGFAIINYLTRSGSNPPTNFVAHWHYVPMNFPKSILEWIGIIVTLLTLLIFTPRLASLFDRD